MKRVLVFGVFDSLHPGHHYFLKSAKNYGEELVVVVARDRSVGELKYKTPAQPETIRLEQVQQLPYVAQAILGDSALGSYAVLRETKPDLICLGYDQNLLASDLQERMFAGSVPVIPLVRVEKYDRQTFATPSDLS